MVTALRGFALSLALLAASPVGAALAYDGPAAAQYADTYWSSYNKQYPSFANQGGDCTNFVSQALYAGVRVAALSVRFGCLPASWRGGDLC